MLRSFERLIDAATAVLTPCVTRRMGARRQSSWARRRLWFTFGLALLVLVPPRVAPAGTITAAGQNTFGQATVPASMDDIASIVAGRDFSLALDAGGALIGWGHNGENRATPPPDLGEVLALSSGIYHTLALRADGTVTGWGFNGNRILSLPNLTEVLAMAAGGYHSLAVRRDGTVVGWGFDGNGRRTPPATLTDVIAIDAGRDHSVALKSDGTVVAWGLNDHGQTEVPASLGIGGSPVIAISAGDNHTLALRADGTVVAWGQNDSRATDVPAGLNNAVAIAAGGRHSLALQADGAVVGWGDHGSGQLNLSGNNIRAIAAGGHHSLALHGNGPLIATQPRCQTVLAGASVSFSLLTTDNGLVTYQWQFNGRDIPGATAATLLLAEVSRADAGVYSARVSNDAGSTRSANAVLIVRGLQQLAAPQLLASGALRLTFGDQHGDPISAPNVFRYRLEVSEDLQTWTPLNQALALVEGRIVIEDPEAGSHPKRFYRVVEK
jgi:alpha-tubulin suppressor-like RCC1 family protein